MRDLITVVDSSSPLADILQQQYESLEELEEAIAGSGEEKDQALVELMLKIINKKGITREVGTSPVRMKEARN